MIPKKFVDKYGESLPNTLCLKTPNGAEWNLNLKKCDGKIWFQKGWKEFADYHSLAHGHILLFKCETTYHLKVQVFDLSALEIDYPSKGKEGKISSNNQGNKPLEGQKRKDNSSLKFLQAYQMRSDKHVKVDDSLILPKKVRPHSDTNCKEETNTIANQVTALDRASSFKPCNPFFMVVMHPSYVLSNDGSPLSLPSKFCKRHLDFCKKQRIIKLQLLTGRVWPAKYTINSKGITRITSGWKPFVKHNNLKVGDVCTFELIHPTKLTFLVHIFRE
ncbi:hypothetical protein VNO78_21550 [Psophocarpus tetragonolobus]|uniref:TF-B3 domain-containing protein n=1 Tax=Psophocarpus tetragonolobus TaxID=3891 RepID=A0AAN9XHS7_PSOTE